MKQKYNKRIKIQCVTCGELTLNKKFCSRKCWKGTKRTSEDKEKISLGVKIAHANDPQILIKWKESIKGRKSWNEGLTKETDNRLKKVGESIRKSKETSPTWNKGLTKEIDERVRLNSEYISQAALGQKYEHITIIDHVKEALKIQKKLENQNNAYIQRLFQLIFSDVRVSFCECCKNITDGTRFCSQECMDIGIKKVSVKCNAPGCLNYVKKYAGCMKPEHHFCNMKCYGIWLKINSPSKRPEVGKKISDSNKGKCHITELSITYRQYMNYDWLYNQYVTLDKSPREISKFLYSEYNCECSSKIISNWLNTLKIPLRNPSDAAILAYSKSKFNLLILLYLNQDLLYNLYIVNKKSVKQMATELNCNCGSISSYLRKFNIPLRSRSESAILFCARRERHSCGTGKFIELYFYNFNSRFKEYIRNKFKLQCVICNKSEYDNNKRKLSIHHINYNKNTNCEKEPWKLISLCSRCHAKN